MFQLIRPVFNCQVWWYHMISKGIALFIWKTICKKILHWNMIFSQPQKPGHDPKLTNSYPLPSVSPEKLWKRCEIGINFQNLEVSINGGSPSYGWFIMEKSYSYGWFGGTPILGNLHINCWWQISVELLMNFAWNLWTSAKLNHRLNKGPGCVVVWH